MNDLTKQILLWVFLAVILLVIFSQFGVHSGAPATIDYSQFLTDVKSNNVQSVTIRGEVIEGKRRSGEPFVTYDPATNNAALLGLLESQGVKFRGEPPKQQSMLAQLAISAFPILLLIGFWAYFMRQMQGASGGRGAMSFGKSRARLLGEDQVNVTFADVAGVEEAKQEVVEIVDFLKDPGKFQKLGGKIPKGVLMVGSPGTGKTLLARAIAGEAKVPFFTISGSDFVEMFVGVGASRVRDMFEQAKKHAPCIIFIDEIDAVGRHRGAGLGGGHDEREQTLNQLLVEMDGFEGNEGIIVIAATNRPDVLDPALLRPGRFDRQVVVPLPDVRGREQILKVHMRKVPLGDNVKPAVIARGTPGFSGADLANIVNEAALHAARADKKAVEMSDFDSAIDRVIIGLEKRNRVMNAKEKQTVAYHEAGHALVAESRPNADRVAKISIIPRGIGALGFTQQQPTEDRYLLRRSELLDRLDVLLGGRGAEEVVFGDVSTGAEDDLQKATDMARHMVTQYGMSARLGQATYEAPRQSAFLDSPAPPERFAYSEHTAQLIDEEIAQLLDEAHRRVATTLSARRTELEALAQRLLRDEVVTREALDELLTSAAAPPAVTP